MMIATNEKAKTESKDENENGDIRASTNNPSMGLQRTRLTSRQVSVLECAYQNDPDWTKKFKK